MQIQVLIDTWWNVNSGVWTIGYGHTGVLIDTWWNVNTLKDSLVKLKQMGFNRYMVECEFYNDTLMEAMKDVLIDTWWNVNDCACLFLQNEVHSFNRYMVECE